MDIRIDINEQQCIGCERCAKICPSTLFQIAEGKVQVNSKGCIVCGHCVAVCPTECIAHSDFPKSKIHAINRDLFPSGKQLMELIKARRSNRSFTDKPIPAVDLEQIIEAAYRAPTASNKQQLQYTLITDPAKLKQLSDLTIGAFVSVFKKINNPLIKPILKMIIPEMYSNMTGFKKLVEEHKEENDLILRGATAVLLIHSPKKSYFGCGDSNLAYQNGSLMAETLGVAQFYTGFVCSAAKQSKKINKLFNIEGVIHAGMALAIPEIEFPRYIDRKEIDFKVI